MATHMLSRGCAKVHAAIVIALAYVVQAQLCVPECASGQGTCEATGCACLLGYAGKTCNESVCDANCNDRGLCTSPNNCRCFQGFEGQLCAGIVYPNSFNDTSRFSTADGLLVTILIIVLILLLMCVVSWNKNGKTTVIYPPPVSRNSRLGPIVSRVTTSKVFVLWIARSWTRREDFFDNGTGGDAQLLRPRNVDDLDPALPSYENVRGDEVLQNFHANTPRIFPSLREDDRENSSHSGSNIPQGFGANDSVPRWTEASDDHPTPVSSPPSYEAIHVDDADLLGHSNLNASRRLDNLTLSHCSHAPSIPQNCLALESTTDIAIQRLLPTQPEFLRSSSGAIGRISTNHVRDRLATSMGLETRHISQQSSRFRVNNRRVSPLPLPLPPQELPPLLRDSYIREVNSD